MTFIDTSQKLNMLQYCYTMLARPRDSLLVVAAGLQARMLFDFAQDDFWRYVGARIDFAHVAHCHHLIF